MSQAEVSPFENLAPPRVPPWLWLLTPLGMAAALLASPLATVSRTVQLAAAAVAVVCLALVAFGFVRAVGCWRRELAALNQTLGSSTGATNAGPTTGAAGRQPPAAGEAAALKAELERLRATERELTAAKQAAEAAMMAKGEFLATMSHEIRTPLNGIIPLLDLVMGTQLAPDQREYIGTAFASAKQLLSIVDDILDFSKLDANKLELETVGLNIKELVDSVTRLMGRAAESKGLKLTVAIDPNVRLAARGDATRLRQVLTNLVSNAIKFTERGGIVVQVTKRSENRTHTELLFAVKDSGIGIAAAAQGKLFKEFSQADNSTTRSFGGTGLGLSICKRIVELMGGQIGVKSELGRGSIFWFTVPLGKAVGDVQPGRSEIENARALVVSGDQAMLQRLSALLGQWQMQVVANNVAADVVSKIKNVSSGNYAFDFLLLDFGSMRATALAVLRGVLREPGLDNLHIVFLSGDDQLPDEARLAPRSSVVQRAFADQELRAALVGLLLPETSGQPAERLVGSAPLVAPDPIAAAPQAPTTAAGVGGHVLLVEDNPVNRQVAQRLLSLIGVSFESAEHGRECVDKALATAFDAVLMDCQMPVMDGYTATRTLRKLQEEGKIGALPIIAMTANAMVGDREKCLAAGMDDYMSKPLNRGLIEQMLRKWLPAGARSRGGGQAEARRLGATAMAAPAVTAAAPVVRASGAAIDARVVGDLVELMGSDFQDLVQVYLEDTPSNLQLLERAARSNDIDALIAPSHSLKSTSANLGALLLSEMAKRIEQGARSGDLSDPVLSVSQLQSEFLRVSAQLRGMLQPG
ncbi:MAG: ATP-binding protein [Lysobacterales bacterium]